MRKTYLPLVSIIVPTYNRSEIQEKLFSGYDQQSYQNFEIIIIDDGSTDKTRKTINDLRKKYSKLKISYVFQKNKGPAAARNIGILRSKGEILLIVNDDTVPAKDLVEQHVDWHKQHPQNNIGVLGYFTWSSEISITPFMKWLELRGPQFSYGKIPGENAQWYHFWTCNLSLKKKFLLANGGFDENFPYAAWEDIELGFRLSKKNLKLLYNKNAIAYHYHPTNLISSIERMKKHGYSIGILGDKVKSPLLPPLASSVLVRRIELIDRIFIKKIIENILIKLALFSEKRIQFGLLYDFLLLHFRIVGRREYLIKYGR